MFLGDPTLLEQSIYITYEFPALILNDFVLGDTTPMMRNLLFEEHLRHVLRVSIPQCSCTVPRSTKINAKCLIEF